MQQTSELYKRLLGEEHSNEVRLVIGESGLLADESGNTLVFGTGRNETRLLVEQGGPEDGFTEAEIISLNTHHALFDGETPTVGCTYSGQIDVSMIAGDFYIPRMAQLVPYIRLVSADGTERSEWIKKGVYFIDTRKTTHNDDGLEIITINGFDALLKGQADYPSDESSDYPATDIVIAEKIATAMGVNLDSRTYDIMTEGYTYGLPTSYSMNEVLSSLAMPYLGNWIMTDEGYLRLVGMTEVPKETRLLTDEVGYALIFGTESDGTNVRILV